MSLLSSPYAKQDDSECENKIMEWRNKYSAEPISLIVSFQRITKDCHESTIPPKHFV